MLGSNGKADTWRNIMKNKIENNDFEEMKKSIEDKYDYEFDEEDFEDLGENKPKSGRRKFNGHTVFFVAAGIILFGCIVSLLIWNVGEKIHIDPNEDTSEFDTEPNDYIQPMTNEQIEGKPDDGVLTIMTIGNSPFADDGENNLLASQLGATMGAQIINVALPDSYQSRKQSLGDDSEALDGISLYDVTYGLVNNDVSRIEQCAKDVSDTAYSRAQALEGIDMSLVDCVVIAYDLSDYIDHRNIYNPGDEDDVTTYCGALSAAVKLIQEKYPYIRIVVLSVPACGKTIDGYYVDGTQIDLANGTLNDYIGSEVATCATRGISFIDIYFGVINVDTRDKYLVDDYHLNEDGAKAVAERFNKLIALE